MNEYKKCDKLEKAIKFDRASIEDMIEKIIGGYVAFESSAPGVLAFEDPGLDDRLDWNVHAPKIAEAAGFTLLSVSGTDWSFDDRCDEEALMFVFDTPHTPEDYREVFNNMLDESAEIIDGRLKPREYEVVLSAKSVTYYEAHLKITATSRVDAEAQARALDEAGRAPWESEGSDDEGTEVEVSLAAETEGVQ